MVMTQLCPVFIILSSWSMP